MATFSKKNCENVGESPNFVEKSSDKTFTKFGETKCCDNFSPNLVKFGSNTPNSVQIQWFVNLLKIFPMCISTNHIVRRQFNDGECGGKLG